MEPRKNTRDIILDTAERLFALQGIDQVSIRQINIEAGQRNSSATQYHFGGRDELLGNVVERRRADIDRRRIELFEEVRRDGLESDLRALTSTLVLPVAELLNRNDGSQYYVGVVAQIIGHPQLVAITSNRDYSGGGLGMVLEAFKRVLGHLPPEIAQSRMRMVLRQLYYELADFQRLTLEGHPGKSNEIPLYIAGLIDAIAAVLGGPVSADTSAELARSKLQLA